MTPESTLVSVCAGLVAVDPQSRIIRLVHYTTQEFFEKIRNSRFPTAQANITLICLTYLSSDHLSYKYIKDWRETPFRQYAAQYWRDHLRASPENDVNDLILQILSQPSKLYFFFKHMYMPDRLTRSIEILTQDPNLPPLCAATMFGLESVVVLLLERGVDLTKSVMEGRTTPLNVAAYFAQHRVIEILLDHGSFLENKDSLGYTPLLATVTAVFFSNEERAVAAARSLLDRGADVDSQGTYVLGGPSTSALMRAAENGYVQLLELLVKYGADVNLRDDDGLTALHMAHPSKQTIELLVSHGASVDLKDKAGNTALILVATKGKLDIVKLLLEHRANIDTCNGAGDSALTLAAAAHATPVQWIGYGEGCYSSTDDAILMQAGIKGKSSTIELLLDYGASINLKNKAGNTALTLAAAKGNLDVVKHLLDHGADAHAENEAGDTALSLTIQIGHAEIHQLLLEHLSEPNQSPVRTEVE